MVLSKITIILIVAVLFTGCSNVNNYLINRGNDFIDCFNIAVGTGPIVGVHFQCTDLISGGVGISYCGQYYGFQGRNFVQWSDMQVEAILLNFYDMGHTTAVGDYRPDAFKDGQSYSTVGMICINFLRYDKYLKMPDNTIERFGMFEGPLYTSFNFEIGVGFLFGIKVGFSLGQFADFILGFTTLDIAGDDAAIIEKKTVEHWKN
jgi:hypothetical protein